MMHIACASDDAYAPHAAALIHSIAHVQRGRAVQFHYLHDHTLTAPTQRMLLDFCTRLGVGLQFLAVSAGGATGGLPVSAVIPEIGWYRALLPELLPDLDRVLYLDTDIIATAPLDGFYDMDLEGFQAACINDYLAAIAHPEVARNIDIPYERYFNSGVMLLNLRELRAAGGGRRILDIARQHISRLHFPDQDALNLALGPHTRLVGPEWNYPALTADYFRRHRGNPGLNLASSRAVTRADFSPAIIHYSAHPKPWATFNPYPYFSCYHVHRAQTPWPRSAADARKLKLRALLPMPLIRLLQGLKAALGRAR
jgi:lipopolysaccharide biosynthesis glycosyltransferase